MPSKAISKKFTGLWILLGFFGLLLIFFLWVMGHYNQLVRLNADVEEKWAQVESQYQRRADLVPQLVQTVQGAASFEQITLTDVTEARTQWLNSQSDTSATREDQIMAANTFDTAFSRLLVSVESYPQLQATQNFGTLQTQLEGTENRIVVARMDYNKVVKEYNQATRLFPGVLFARFFGFEETSFFESFDGAETAPQVEFNFE